jgi:hypothetical protein
MSLRDVSMKQGMIPLHQEKCNDLPSSGAPAKVKTSGSDSHKSAVLTLKGAEKPSLPFGSCMFSIFFIVFTFRDIHFMLIIYSDIVLC